MSSLDHRAARLILGTLTRIRSGCLQVELPDGVKHAFGEAGCEQVVAVTVKDWRAFRRVLLDGETGAGESYMDGDWDTTDLVALIRLIIENRNTIGRGTGTARFVEAIAHRLRRNTIRGAKKNISRHYDLGNEFFALFLDPTMTYSAALFDDGSEELSRAQSRKYRVLAEKAKIGADSHVLEIGCGWGGFAEFAAREIGCRVTGITISEKQAEYAEARIRRAGLEDLVTIRKEDYRKVEGSFDRIMSIEMLEAVGHANLSIWFEACDRLLAEDGVMAVQVITIPDQRYAQYRRGSDFIRRHIFPGGHLPSPGAIGRVLEKHTSLGIESLENIAPHYAETLRRWRARLLERKKEVLDMGFSVGFLRRWEYYLAYCEAAFACRVLADLQLVLSRPGNPALGSRPYQENLA